MLAPPKPRICIVNPFEHGGGAEYQIALLIDELCDAGFEVHYLTHFLDSRDRTRRYLVTRVGDGGPLSRFGYVADAASLYRALRDVAPSIIYQRVACAYTGICALYARRHKVPLVWHVSHDTDVLPKCLDQARNVVRTRLEKWLVHWGAKRATRIVVQTDHQAQLLTQNYARHADAVIPNFHPPAIETLDKSGPMTVLWIANLKPWKQPEVFVRLASEFREYRDVRFMMVGAPAAGGGNQHWQKALMRSIENSPNLNYAGPRSQAEVNELLAKGHIFVNTSKFEGFPNTFIQAWSRDAAVVSLQVDPDGILRSRRVGIAANSESRLAQAVRELIEDPTARAGYVHRGREYAAAQHSMRNAARLTQLLDGYRQASAQSA